MARATDKADAAVRRYVQSVGAVGVESKVISAALAGASDSALKLFANIEGGGSSFARVGAQGAAAFRGVGAAADGAAQGSEARVTRILQLAEKARQVSQQAAALTEQAKSENGSGKLSDDGLKQRLADIRTVQAAELQRITEVARADAAARASARAEFQNSSKALSVAQVGSGAATAEVQTKVFLAFAAAQARAAEVEAQAQAKVEQAQAAAAAASERGQAAQRAAFNTKTAYIAKLNEEAAALFRTRDAQRELEAVQSGVSPEQASKLAKLAGDREFLSSVRQQVQAQERLQAEFGKTTVEIAREEAAQRGLSNTAASVISRLDAVTAANQRAAKAASDRKAADSFLSGLNQTASSINTDGTQKAQSVLLAERAALLGVSEQAQAAIAKIALLDAKTGQLGRSSFATTNQLLTLRYTISDIVASAGSGASPLTILLQQGPQLAQVEGGISGVFRAAISLITPFRAAMGGAVAAIGAVGFAWYQGAQQSKAFNDSLVLSGNFAGQTEGSFNAAAKAIAASGQVSISAAREFGQALISTGEVGPEVFKKAADVAARYGIATGQTASEVAKDFAGMSRDAAKWAEEHNRSTNFVTAAQLQQIKTFQETGQIVKAQELIYEALGVRLKALEPNLGNLDKAIRLVTGTWAKFWDNAYDVGREETIEDKIAKLQAKIDKSLANQPSAAQPGEGFRLPDRLPDTPANVARDRQRQDGQLRDQQQQKNAAFLASTAAATTKAALAGRTNVESLLASTKSTEQYSKALKKLNDDFDANERANTPFTDIQKDAARNELKKKFTDQGSVSQADAERKAQLAKDLQVFAEALSKEKDILKFSQDERKAQYDAGNVSLAQYYSDKVAITRAGTQAEVAEQQKAVDRLQQELNRGKFKTKDERTTTEKQLAEAIAKRDKLSIDGDRAAVLSTYERAAAVKALAREVENFAASLQDLQGDPFAAAQSRIAQQVEAARALNAKAAPAGNSPGDFARFDRAPPPVDVAGYEAALQVTAEFAEVQRKVGVASSDAARSEEKYLLSARQSSIALQDQDRGVFAIRAASLVQLGELAEAADKLALASQDPRVQAYAKDLSLQYAKAAEAVDPALNRLLGRGDELAGSLAGIFGGAINQAQSLKEVVSSIGSTLQATLTRTLITEPLEQALKGNLRKFIGGENPVAGFLRDQVGASGSGASSALAGAAQTAAASASTAQAIAARGASVTLAELSLAGTSAAYALQAVSAASAGNSASSLFGGFDSFFGNGGFGTGIDFGLEDLGLFFHSGGVVGQHVDARAVPAGVFNNAARYHDGGAVASAPAVAGLAANEVPAILMGGPRGMREEVLHASDPRHRDNLGMSALQAIIKNTVNPIKYHTGGLAGMRPDYAPAVFRRPMGGGAANPGSSAAASGITINQTMNVGDGVSISQVQAAMEANKRTTISTIQDMQRRGEF